MAARPRSIVSSPPPLAREGTALAVAGDVKHRDRLAEALEREVADFFEAEIGFDRAGDALCDQDLAVGGGIAEPRGEVAYGADRRVVDPLGKADLAEGRIALGDADAE